MGNNMEFMKYALAAVLSLGAVFFAVWRMVSLMKTHRNQKRPSSGSASNYVQMNVAAMQSSGMGNEYIGDYRTVKGFLVKLDVEKQNRHMPGRNAYEIARTNGNLRSVIFRDANALQKLLDEKAGTGEFIGNNKEKIDFGQTIGQYVDVDGRSKRETRIGIIHYGPDGAYIVPARPSEGGVSL